MPEPPSSPRAVCDFSCRLGPPSAVSRNEIEGYGLRGFSGFPAGDTISILSIFLDCFIWAFIIDIIIFVNGIFLNMNLLNLYLFYLHKEHLSLCFIS